MRRYVGPAARCSRCWHGLLPGLFAALAVACEGIDQLPYESLDPAGTPELRAALFDTIMARTERREAFSPIKNERLGFDPLADMRALRDEVVAAATEEALYYALARLSHARRDRHLDVLLVPGGLTLPDSAGLEVAGGPDPEPPRQAALKVFPDYSDDAADSDYFLGQRAYPADNPPIGDGRFDGLPVGSRVVRVNGLPVAEWHDSAAAYIQHSTLAGLRWKIAEAMTQSTAAFPPHLRADTLTLEFAHSGRAANSFRLEYHRPDDLVWSTAGEPDYPVMSVALQTATFDLLMPKQAHDADPFVVLRWRGFREAMVADVDSLMAFAAAHDLLDHAMVVDVTRSRGGSLGAYALQRLQSKPFKTTFGNLRISDVTRPFIEEKREDFAARDINDGGVPETIDDGTWLMDWLENDVLDAIERGDAYTNNVPFKLAHAPRDSDGILAPARVLELMRAER